jgi:hypothetical protein
VLAGEFDISALQIVISAALKALVSQRKHRFSVRYDLSQVYLNLLNGEDL